MVCFSLSVFSISFNIYFSYARSSGLMFLSSLISSILSSIFVFIYCFFSSILCFCFRIFSFAFSLKVLGPSSSFSSFYSSIFAFFSLKFQNSSSSSSSSDTSPIIVLILFFMTGFSLSYIFLSAFALIYPLTPRCLFI